MLKVRTWSLFDNRSGFKRVTYVQACLRIERHDLTAKILCDLCDDENYTKLVKRNKNIRVQMPNTFFYTPQGECILNLAKEILN